MSKLLVVEGSTIVKGVFKELLDKDPTFDYKLVGTYAEASALLSKTRYEFAVVDRTLSDAPNGEIIALFNKYNIAPFVFTNKDDEDFFESFQSAKIVEYMIRNKFNNIVNVIQKLKQLQANKNISVLIVSHSKIYSRYLKENLNLHNFKVLSAWDNEEALSKIQLHPELSLVVLDQDEPYIDSLTLVQNIRADKSLKNLKILALVDESNAYATSTLLNSGPDDFIVKQLSRSEFYVRVYQNVKTMEVD